MRRITRDDGAKTEHMELEQAKQERKEDRIVRNGIGDVAVAAYTPTEWNCFTLVSTQSTRLEYDSP